ncbi:prolyl-tRNA synthetase [Paenibacillus sp. 1_12]|uniref:proline--tRNA ligase n=1 Tax=Paenibacillus sp. 1_12 TaxID=1566278 RepID=UPI0008F0E51B|nr:proline--tRNA ligase [Paenibacillus sp. 1_12]SFL73801.1 prolyl-tRNA synthetase [Paenibacillus sp. 1_12]
MRQRHALIPTLREIPSDAEAASHQLLLRAGYIRQLAAGIYTYLPLGRKVLRKLEAIVREEMDMTQAQEILMPAMQPAELWHQSGRHAVYGPELIRFQDRNAREFALGPTHEEVVTSLIRDEINSYRKLPLIVYQIQSKFRDERRPRFGLLRGREFVMKDAYSFDTSWEGVDLAYQAMYNAYHRIFDRCGLKFRAVEADAGAIGGEGGTHEFMALTDIGEDTIVTCECCGYAANLERAGSRPFTAGLDNLDGSDRLDFLESEKIATPHIKTIEQLVQFLNVSADQLIKTLIYVADGKPIAVCIRGDHEVNETKLKNYLHADNLELADADTIALATGAPSGYIGPIQLPIALFVDHEAAHMKSAITGANHAGFHLRNVRPGRDFSLEYTADLRNVAEGDLCLHCENTLKLTRGIEIGHIFKLGTKYSEPLKACFVDADGKEQPMLMGCYGIGISRLLSAVVEQSHDANGILWPFSIAPFHVHIVPVSVQDTTQMQLAESLYAQLGRLGADVLLDDREERPGVKLKDADLIGIPIRIVVGKKAGEGLIEWKERGSAEALELTAQEATEQVALRLRNHDQSH